MGIGCCSKRPLVCGEYEKVGMKSYLRGFEYCLMRQLICESSKYVSLLRL